MGQLEDTVAHPDEAAIAAEFLRLWGLSGVSTAVREGDEMLGHIRRNCTRPDHALLDYLVNGHTVTLVLDHDLGKLGRTLTGLDRVLDFACGCGRVTRFLTHALGGARVWAADVDRTAVDWCAAALGAQPVHSTRDPDDVDLPGSFDLIFVGSLFTHLPLCTFDRWLARLFDALTPTGVLAFTTHGEGLAPEIAKDPSGFTFVECNETGGRLDLADYGTTFVRPDRLREIGAETGVHELHHFERELWHGHDLWLARRSPTPEWSGCGRTPIAYGEISRADFPQPDQAIVAGVVSVASDAPDVRDVRLHVDGIEFGGVQLGDTYRTGNGRKHRDWVLGGNAAALSAGRHLVAGVADLGDGRPQCFDVVAMRR